MAHVWRSFERRMGAARALAASTLVALVLGLALAAGCGSSLPARYVLERDLGSYAYRRYQKLIDVELPIAGKKAVGHTAIYFKRDGSRFEILSAFITIYDKPAALASEVRDRLSNLGSYERSVVERDGEYVHLLDGGDDRWLLWVSGRFVVKLGVSGDTEVPEEVTEEYLELYPSDLDEHGRAEHGAPSAGRSSQEKRELAEEETEMPAHLRENAPR